MFRYRNLQKNYILLSLFPLLTLHDIAQNKSPIRHLLFQEVLLSHPSYPDQTYWNFLIHGSFSWNAENNQLIYHALFTRPFYDATKCHEKKLNLNIFSIKQLYESLETMGLTQFSSIPKGFLFSEAIEMEHFDKMGYRNILLKEMKLRVVKLLNINIL